MAADDDSAAKLRSLTSALRSLDRPRSESDRPADAAHTLPLIREPLFTPEPPATEAPEAEVRPTPIQVLRARLQANRGLIGGVCLAVVALVVVGAGIRFLWPRLKSAISSSEPATATSPSSADALQADAAGGDSGAAADGTRQDAQPAAASTTASARRRATQAASERRTGGRSSSGPESVEGEGLVPSAGVASAAESPSGSVSLLNEANTTFSLSDGDVIPPTAIDAQTIIKLRPVTPGIRHEALIIAVVIDQRGLVDSVKAVMPPRDLGESVILMGALASAKSWRFHPATKGGRPVRFRQIFELADTPAR